ncbi:MAG TPA: CoA transferase [Frankiaceae bacterium]|nr:CoA transferase [Frankiaceae bacterium]
MNRQPSVDVFQGVRVIELAQWVFVPVAGAMLADWGADVIKVEHPDGDGYRQLVIPGSGTSTVNYSMEMANRNKRSVAINLKSPDGRAALLRLLESADVFLTNFLPSVLERLGLGADEIRALNPRLIYARGHGYGTRGPDADTPAYDSTAFWARGAIEETLAPLGLPEPLPQRGAVGDRYAATHLAFGIAGALFRRDRTGEGCTVDVSLLSTALWMISSDVLASLQGAFRQSPELGRPRVTLPNPLAANYRCGDGRWLTMCCLQPDKYWADVCAILERPDLLADARFIDMKSRAEHSGVLVAELEATFARRPMDGWRRELDDARIPWAPFQTVDELVDDPQIIANGYIGTVEREGAEPFPLPAGVVQFDEKSAALHAAPGLGEHTDEVLMSLGYSWDEVVELKLSDAIL